MIDSFDDKEAFEWDKWNLAHIAKHRVTYSECEEVFANIPLFVRKDSTHSEKEKRFQVLGQSSQGRCLFIVFTARENAIRIISARDQNKKERHIFRKEGGETQ